MNGFQVLDPNGKVVKTINSKRAVTHAVIIQIDGGNGEWLLLSTHSTKQLAMKNADATNSHYGYWSQGVFDTTAHWSAIVVEAKAVAA